MADQEGWGLKCPECGTTKLSTKDIRPAPYGQVRRRRECENHHRFTTYENIA